MAASINALYRQSEHTTQHRAGKKNDDSTTTIDYSLLLKHEDTRQRLCAALPFLVLQKIVPVAQPDLSYYSHLIRFSLITMHLQDDTFKRYRLLRTFRI